MYSERGTQIRMLLRDGQILNVGGPAVNQADGRKHAVSRGQQRVSTASLVLAFAAIYLIWIHLPGDSVCGGKYSATADDGGPALHRRHSVVRVVAIPRHTCADKNSLEERCNRWWSVFSGQSRNVGLGGTESAVGISGPVVRDLAFVDRGALALHG